MKKGSKSNKVESSTYVAVPVIPSVLAKVVEEVKVESTPPQPAKKVVKADDTDYDALISHAIGTNHFSDLVVNIRENENKLDLIRENAYKNIFQSKEISDVVKSKK
jgi:uncharacterized protein Yka (UPF0111/DUF47 family)